MELDQLKKRLATLQGLKDDYRLIIEVNNMCINDLFKQLFAKNKTIVKLDEKVKMLEGMI